MKTNLCTSWKRKVVSMALIAMMVVTSIPAAMVFTGERVHADSEKSIGSVREQKTYDVSELKEGMRLSAGDIITGEGKVSKIEYFLDKMTYSQSDKPFPYTIRTDIAPDGLWRINSISNSEGNISISLSQTIPLTGEEYKITDLKEGMILKEGDHIVAGEGQGRFSELYYSDAKGKTLIKESGSGAGLPYAIKAYKDIKEWTVKSVRLQASQYNFIYLYTPKVIGGDDPEPTPPAKITAPKTISAKALSKSEIKVSWSKVSKATQYLVYVSTSKSGTYTLLDTVKNTALKADGLAANKTYYFKVKAKGSAGTSGFSKVISAKTKAAGNSNPGNNDKPTNNKNPQGCTCTQPHSKAWFTLKQVNSSQIRVTWKAQKGAKLYQVANNHTSKKTMKIKWTGNNGQRKYLSIGKAKGKNYQFKMRTIKYNNGKRVYGPWSSTSCITMK